MHRLDLDSQPKFASSLPRARARARPRARPGVIINIVRVAVKDAVGLTGRDEGGRDGRLRVCAQVRGHGASDVRGGGARGRDEREEGCGLGCLCHLKL